MILDHLENIRFVRKLAQFQFGVNQLIVQLDFEAATSGGDELQFLDFLFEAFQYLARQTDSLRLIVSNRAIFEF